MSIWPIRKAMGPASIALLKRMTFLAVAPNWLPAPGIRVKYKDYLKCSLVSYLSDCQKHGLSIIGTYGKIGVAEMADFAQKGSVKSAGNNDARRS